jgi:hypothetical protein
MIAMGLTILASAKAITSAYVTNGKVTKPTRHPDLR